MSIGQEFPKARAWWKARYQRTQEPNTTDTLVNLSNKRLTTAEKKVLNKWLSFVLNPKKTNSREIITTAEKKVLNKWLSFVLNPKKTNSREIMPNLDEQIYTELYPKNNQPPKQTSQNKLHTRIGNTNEQTHTKTSLCNQMLEQKMPHMPRHSNKTPICKNHTWNNTHNKMQLPM